MKQMTYVRRAGLVLVLWRAWVATTDGARVVCGCGAVYGVAAECCPDCGVRNDQF